MSVEGCYHPQKPGQGFLTLTLTLNQGSVAVFVLLGFFFFLLFFLMSEKETHHTETVQMFYVHLMEHNFIIFFRTSQNTRPTLYVSLECGMIQGTDRGNVQLASETSLTSLSTGPSGQNHDKSFYVNIHPNMDN